jgi:hypothetical protein
LVKEDFKEDVFDLSKKILAGPLDYLLQYHLANDNITVLNNEL